MKQKADRLIAACSPGLASFACFLDRTLGLLLFALPFYFLAPQRGRAQLIHEKNFGLMAGAVVSGGTHVSQFGFFIRTYYVFLKRLQWNNDVRATYYFRYLGPRIPHPELQLSSGILIGYGGKSKKENFFMNKVSSQTGYRKAAAYAYTAYFNKIRTSQQTGIISLQFGNFFLSHENDILARPLLDRFRTGGLQAGYQEGSWRLALTQINWTGRLGNAVKDTLYHKRTGYLDTTSGVYPLLSHGLLYFSAEYAEREFFQQLQAAAGIDAEQVRHAVQNRFVHDGWRNPSNFHFPMIDNKGQPYLRRPGQKVRKPRVYFNLFANPDVIY